MKRTRVCATFLMILIIEDDRIKISESRELKSAHGFFASYIRKGIDIKNLKRIESTKEENKKLKVAAYCKVSTKFESQQSSIDLKISNYETIIRSNRQWEYAGVYYDFGS